MPDERPTARPVVTISATYGAGGRYIGERVATALGVTFLNHIFSSEEMEREHRRWEESDAGPRFAVNRTRGDEALDDSILDRALTELESHATLEASDAHVRSLVNTGGVVVGRAGPHLLRDVPGVLHVLVDGPLQARIAQGAAYEHVDLATAARRQLAHDGSRLRVARRHYGADPLDLRYYSMVLDTTALGLDDSVNLILRAVEARRRQATGGDAPPPGSSTAPR